MTALDLYRSLRGSIARATGKPGAYLRVLPGDARAGAGVRAVRARGEGEGARVRCHPTGREDEGEHGGEGRDDDD